MVEVFKTNVKYQEEAAKIVDRIRMTFDGYDANFDLEDCDKILRVCSLTKNIDPNLIIRLVMEAGFSIEILDEDMNTISSVFSDINGDLIILTASLSLLVL
ncbi:hypothetical protein L0657_12620 [Dyadobacter sp. CY345]|uniref:hypothetical protein n=1 Tax=Dyadobacter sp. CY345 TaxID=2909335 RepID=UPI001F33C305|nr:hypothetical protein [Dyadobacter sp. CY345]MCF2444804.1 hypothetical protein [Dyadobacter sp. CY345]